MSTTLGYLSVLGASIFFGSNYVPLKIAQLGYTGKDDGFFSNLFMSMGIALVGFVSLLMQYNEDTILFSATGLLGGSFWACGNFLAIFAIRWAGIGSAFFLWSAANLIGSWIYGTFGFFGLVKPVLTSFSLNVTGFLFLVASLIVFIFVKPDSALKEEEFKLIEDLEEKEKKPASVRLLGNVLAFIAGIFYSVCLIPFVHWSANSDRPVYEYAFSQFSGILLFNMVVFVIYSIVRKEKMLLQKELAMPAFYSGIGWAIACVFWFISTYTLGNTVGYQMVCVGPIIITTLWSMIYFKEYTKLKPILIFFFSVVLMLIGIVCLALSK
ncbi:hypothetical protein PCE1_001690 [Barthelona sp. PCE]